MVETNTTAGETSKLSNSLIGFGIHSLSCIIFAFFSGGGGADRHVSISKYSAVINYI